MNSEVTDEFRSCFRRLPDRIKNLARKNYKIWKANPVHPSVDFKRVGKKSPIYSIRVGIGWRALGLKERNKMLWFWIGSHAEYDKLLNK